MIYDPRDPATIQDPLPALLWLQEHDPVHWSATLKGWVFTRYDDVRAVQVGKGVSADRLTPFYTSLPEHERSQLAEVVRYLNTWVAFKDPPEHGRLRALMNRAFTPAVVSRLEAAILEIADLLISDLEDRERFDFIADFANPLPAMVIMDLLGVPRSDMQLLRAWSADIQPFLGSAMIADNKYEMARDGILGLAHYFQKILEDRRTKSQEDLIGNLLRWHDKGEISSDEIIGSCILFLFAGHETTTNLIGNGLRALLRHPDAMAQLREDPAMMGTAIEEMLRWDGPTGALVRLVAMDHERMGRHLKRGDRVFIMVNAANRDPRRFIDPGRFDISRSPNPHLTFNTGAHFCLGAPLARAEGRIAMTRFLGHFDRIEMEGGSPEYMDTLVMRGMRRMPVRVQRAASPQLVR